MERGTGETFQIVMREVAEEHRSGAAMFLSGCFSLPPASGRNIAASAPVALLAELERGQAEAIVAELRPALPGGVALEIRSSGDAGDTEVSRLQWPRPPRIYGKDIIDFAEAAESSHEAKCPVCGGMLRIVTDGGAVRIAPLAERARPGGGDTAVMTAPAPAPADDRDPLFSGIAPLAAANGNYPSLRSLQAGDTGFWMDNKGIFSAAAQSPDASPLPVPGDTSHSRRARAAGGLAAFMKPGVFAVVASRSRDAQVVKMVAEIMGVSEPEARDRCLALSLTVARGISLDEAQSLLARLRNLGARARIVRPA